MRKTPQDLSFLYCFQFPLKEVTAHQYHRFVANVEEFNESLKDHQCCLVQQCFAMLWLCHALPRPNDLFSWTVSWPWSVWEEFKLWRWQNISANSRQYKKIRWRCSCALAASCATSILRFPEPAFLAWEPNVKWLKRETHWDDVSLCITVSYCITVSP